jgi:hypothetical protein
MLADNLTATAPHIVVARLNCEEAERFCNDDIRISRTPEFKVRRACVPAACEARMPWWHHMVLRSVAQCNAELNFTLNHAAAAAATVAACLQIKQLCKMMRYRPALSEGFLPDPPGVLCTAQPRDLVVVAANWPRNPPTYC